jgi:serine/threonine-protein kinase
MQKDLSRTTDLGSYRLESLLGKGGMGEVWRARHRLLRRDAAVKLVRPDLLSTAGASDLRHIRRRFEQEAQAIASLRSPHTVALYDFGLSDDGSLYYAMELLEGLDAESLVNRYGPQPAGRVISLLRQACDSLEEAHDLKMVHRDVKPTNLFVCRLGKQVDFVKVLDFGLVKAALNPGQAQLTMQGETSGTPAFMAPEQVRAEPDIDGRADIYSLGCVAYFLLTGELVFDEPTPMATALAHVENDPAPPSRRSELPIPASLERVIMACLEKKRDQRPQSVAELASLLESCTDVPLWTPADGKQWWDLHRPEQSAGVAA